MTVNVTLANIPKIVHRLAPQRPKISDNFEEEFRGISDISQGRST
jgi:hypothetical protein